MPFLDDGTIRALYDVNDGGPPLGYYCLYVDVCTPKSVHDIKNCRKVTRTLNGMRMHQQRVHGIKPQMEISFENIAQANQSNR